MLNLRHLLIALLLLPGAALAATAERLVLLVENRSANAAAGAELKPILVAALSRKGYEVVAGPEVDAAGIADPEALAPDTAAKLFERFKAQGVLAVTVRFFLDPHDRTRGPRASGAMGLTAKSFSVVRPTWRNSRSVVEDESPRKRPMAAMVVARLLWTFPRAQGATLANASEEWDEMTGAPPQARTGPAAVPNYDVLIERMRAARTGPRFPLRMGKKNR